MVHNGIEYGLMAAYAEGLNILASPARLRPGHDAETAPLSDPEYYQYELDMAGSRRSGGAAASSARGCST